MEKRIFPNYSGRELIELLESNSDDAEERTYYVPLEENEIIERKDRFATLSIKLEKIEERKKELIDEIKQEMSPIVDERKEILNEIKLGAKEEEGVVFKFVDHEEGVVGFYNQHGVLIDSRPAMDSERRQFTIGGLRRSGTEQ